MRPRLPANATSISNRSRLTRREWSMMLGIAPLATMPLVAATAADDAPSLRKAIDGVHGTSDRLAQLEVPMNIEPSFVFKV